MLTRTTFLIGSAIVIGLISIVSMQISHPIKAEIWLALCVGLFIQAIAGYLKP